MITAYNLVVDSNAGSPSSYAPRSAYLGATFHNDGSVPLTDIVAHIGNFTNGAASSTPGLYPSRVHPGLTGPLAGGAFALTHEGGSAGLADATRYIASIPAGGSVTVYWLIGYPQLDVNGVPTWGASVKPDDDLWLDYDVWATAREGGATRQVDLTRSFTFHNEISASANKIFPNGANKVPDYYKELLNQYTPSWTNANYDGTVGSLISTDGVWYDLGNVGEGFDNNGDLIPDRNAWMQPVGDPTTFDPSAFRLVRTYAFVIVKLKTGGELVLSGQDQLYFENIPENNGAVGYVRYQFMPLLSGASGLTTPYQEVASGRDNEKFNADYGISLGEALVAGEAHVTIDKSASVATTAPGGTIAYTVAYTNSGSAPVGNPEFGLPLVVQDAVPAGTSYLAGSATNNNALPSALATYQVFYSTDGGLSWTNAQPTPAAAVTHLQWWINTPLAAGEAGAIRFQVAVDSTYTEPSPLIVNEAGLSFGDTAPFAADTAETRVLGVNAVGDTVYADTGAGAGGYFGNGLQDGTEPGLPGITVWLYADVNGNGAADAGEPLVGTTETGASGSYLFSSVTDGRFVVVVDAADATLAMGDTVTTPERVAVNLDSAGATANAVTNLTADFGFAPALTISKARVGSGTLREGQLVTYALSVTNRLVGDGSGDGRAASYLVYPTNGTSGTGGNKVFLNAANLWRPGEPDQTYATAPYKDAGENVVLAGFYRGAQLGTPTNVMIHIPLRVNGSFAGNGSTLDVNVRNYLLTLGTRTLTCNTMTNGILSYDITSYFAGWRWTNFNGSALSIELVAKKAGNPTATLDIDSVGFKVTTDQLVGGSSGTTTLDPVPLDDTFDPGRLQFVSAVPPADSVATNGGAGALHWDNLGPLHAGGVRVLSTTFKVLQPPGNVAAPLTNTASVTAATYLSGRPANGDEKKVTDSVLPAGTIGDYVWRDLNADGVQNAGEPGISGVTVRLYTNATALVATAVTDAGGLYLFEGLEVSTVYTVTVDAATLPGGAGTCTKDRDATANGTTAFALDVTSTAGGDTVLDADFGYTLQSLIRGTVWHDRDRDAYPAPESGEELFGGVTVGLYTAGGVWITNTTTSAGGAFQFTGAYSGDYSVRVSTNTGALASGVWALSYDTDTVTNGANQVAVTLPLGGQAQADYSYYQLGAYALGDTLFYDWNGNGAQDVTNTLVEAGIANVTVQLYQDENTNGVVDAGVDALVGVTSTSASGVYSFTNLVAGTYLVAVDQADTDLPALYLNTGDPYGARDGRSVLTLTTASNWAQDFGYQPYGFNTVGDTVWYDTDGDGVQSGSSERGLANVTVRLYADLGGSNSYALVGTAVTDASGHYLFGSLPDGSYRVAVDTASAGLPSDAFGHAYRPTTDTFLGLTLSGGQAVLTADFGFAALGAIGDTIYWDNNANGDQDWTEPGIAGVSVSLYLDTGASNGVYDVDDVQAGTNVWTDADGRYLFSGLAQGGYVVMVDASSQPLDGAILRADPEMDGEPCPFPPLAGVGCDAQTDVNILPGTSFMGADFGYQPQGVIGDLVWIDLNTNGVFDAGEQGIPYVTVSLYSGMTLVATNLTDGDGYYSFGNVSDGTYRVLVSTNGPAFPSGLTATCDADGTADSVANSIVISDGKIVSIGGSAVTNADLTVDFGYRYAGSSRLSGTVGLDDPAYDGALNGVSPSGVGAGEYPFAGTAVYLYLWNDNANGLLELGEYTLIASTLTAANGDYQFASLPGGDGNDSYVVSLAAPADELRLTTLTTPQATAHNATNSFGITLSAYQVVTVVPERDNVDFAFRSVAARDFGDLPLSYSTTVADQPIGPSHTVVAGQDLWLGSAATTVEPNGTPSATASADAAEDGVVVTNQWREGAAGGTVTVTVGAGSGWLVGWVDFNRDGTFTNMNERVIEQPVSVAVNGGVTNLTFDIPAGTFSTAGATVLNARFRLYTAEPFAPMFTGAAVGGEVEDHQFTFGIIGNYVWDDLDGNGIQNAGEPGVSNATVRLYGPGKDLIDVAATAADGGFVLVGLQPGNYSVEFVAPSGSVFTVEGAGGAPQLDSDVDAAGASGNVTLSANDPTRLDIDAGLYVPAAVYGHLFVDRNADLLRNTNDSSVTNALVRLTVGGVVIDSTSTDANGYYCFTNVPVGTVSILVSRASATLLAVPATNDVTRNRAQPIPNDEAYIAYPVTSGYGVLSSRPGEPLNFGFSDYSPLSSAMDVTLFATGNGGVTVELWTSDESGYADIVVYAWLDNAWTEVGRVPGNEVWGEGSNRYSIHTKLLSADNAYHLKIVDEAGHVHLTGQPVTVRAIRVDAVRLELQTLTLGFNTEPYRTYVVMVSTDLSHWKAEQVSAPRADGWSAYSDLPFTAEGERVQVRVPVNGRRQAYFKIVLAE